MAGQYCLAGSSNGTFCPPGTYLDTTGGTQESDCLACTQGSFCDGYGNVVPDGPCDAGYYCPAGMNTSSPAEYTCPAGEVFDDDAHQKSVLIICMCKDVKINIKKKNNCATKYGLEYGCLIMMLCNNPSLSYACTRTLKKMYLNTLILVIQFFFIREISLSHLWITTGLDKKEEDNMKSYAIAVYIFFNFLSSILLHKQRTLFTQDLSHKLSFIL